MTEKDLLKAYNILLNLPEPYQEIALEIMENELLGKKKENEKINKKLEVLNYKITD